MRENWNVLINRDIINIFIGDVVIKEDLFNQYRMPYLRGEDIFELAKNFNLELSYDVGPKHSRWKYMQILIEHCIKQKQVSELINQLIELKNFKNVLKNVEPRYIRSMHNDLVWAFIEKVNGVLTFEDYILNYNGKMFSIAKIDETPYYKVESKDYNKIITDFCKKIKKDGLETKYGIVTEIIEQGNQGGNGRILFGKLNKKEVAIKILYNNNTNKQNRFFDEFINVFMSLNKVKGFVFIYFYVYIVLDWD